MTKVGLQLWTIRDECDRDLAATLRRVGELGYDGVELFQLHGHEAAEVRAWLDAAGLVALGRHAKLDVLETHAEQLTAELATLGADQLALSWVDPDGLDRPGELVARIQAAANAFREPKSTSASTTTGPSCEPSTTAGRSSTCCASCRPICSGSSSTSAGSGRPAPTRRSSSTARRDAVPSCT